MNFQKEERSLVARLLGEFGITPKELLCLAFWHYGYSAKESAIFLDNSPRTIEGHRSKVFHRFKPMTQNDVKQYLIKNEYSSCFESIVKQYFVERSPT